MEGRLIIISAPSGAGKTTIVKELLRSREDLEFSVSATSRPRRPGEEEGRDYYFISVDDFKKKIYNKEFIEWEEVYKDLFYGTLRTEVDRIWENGRHVAFDVDVMGGLNIKRIFGSKALALFIKPPSLEALKDRLTNRGTENKESLDKRLEKAAFEMSFADKFDQIIVNDDLPTAIQETFKLVDSFLKVN